MYEGSGSDEESLAVTDNWPLGTNCQWLIASQNEDDFVTLEFQNLYVNNKLYYT